MYVVPVEHWNTERWHPRFHTGAYEFASPFARTQTGRRFYLYVNTKNLDQFLHVPEAATVLSAPADIHLSPYLKLAHAVGELKITPDNQPKKAVVEDALRRLWTGAEPLSGNLLGTLATICREPESAKGRAVKG